MKVNHDDSRAFRLRLPILFADLEDGQVHIHFREGGYLAAFEPVEIGSDYICFAAAKGSAVRNIVPFHAIERIELTD